MLKQGLKYNGENYVMDKGQGWRNDIAKLAEDVSGCRTLANAMDPLSTF